MATRIYTGVGGKARKVNRIYVGVDGKARSVKKVYVGVNGKARLVYKIIYKLRKVKDALSIAPISHGRVYLTSASVGNYALFAGGCDKDTRYSTVDAYDSQFTHILPSALCDGKIYPIGGNIGNHALIVGGTNTSNLSNNTGNTTTVDVYDTSLIRTSGTKLYNDVSAGIYAANKKYALFGRGDSNNSTSNIGTAYDNSLIAHKIYVTDSGGLGSGASVGKYALFAGGTLYEKKVDAYDETLTKRRISDATCYRSYSSGVMTDHYAIFGGNLYSKYEVDVYNENLTKVSAANLLHSSHSTCGVSLKGFAVIQCSNYVQYYDDNLTIQLSENMNDSRYNAKAAIAGNYIIVAGGRIKDSNFITPINAYMVN